MVNNLVRRALLHYLTTIENDDLVRHLGDYGEVVGNIDRGRIFFLNYFFKGFQNLDLGGHIERGGGFVEDQ